MSSPSWRRLPCSTLLPLENTPRRANRLRHRRSLTKRWGPHILWTYLLICRGRKCKMENSQPVEPVEEHVEEYKDEVEEIKPMPYGVLGITLLTILLQY